MIALVLLLASTAICSNVVSSAKTTPAPDLSQQCLSCQAQVELYNIVFSNQTSIDAVTKELKVKCLKNKDSVKEKLVCDKLVDAVVKIPPAIFAGMADLAWPLPLGLCAFIRECSVNCCGSDSPPEQIHLSLVNSTTTQSTMAVSWVTLTDEGSVVQYGKSADDLSLLAAGSTLTYTSSGWVGTVHRAIMVQLEEAKTYFYRVGDGKSSWSDVYSFKTFDPASTANFAVIADMAYDTFSDNTVKALTQLVDEGKINAVIHSGDISYADGFDRHFDDFMNKIQPIAARVPYMITPGNHEIYANFKALKTRFFMPRGVEGADDGMYYVWNYGNVNFLAMNSESAIDLPNFDKDELEFFSNVIAADGLNNVKSLKDSFLVSHFHRPMYCSQHNDECEWKADRLKKQTEDFLYASGVELVLTGHVHCYERTTPVYKNSADASGPVHIMQGSSGNREGNNGFPEDVQAWSAARSSNYGYGILSVSADGASMRFGFYDAASMALLDSVDIQKR